MYNGVKVAINYYLPMAKERIEVDETDKAIIVLALTKLEDQATKIGKNADKLGMKKMTLTAAEFIKRIQELASKFL